MSEAVALQDPPGIRVVEERVSADAGASGSAPGSRPPRRESGGFRLIHYVALVSIAFVLAIAVVWLQVSCVRQGYLVEDTKRELNAQTNLLERKSMQFKELTSPLNLHAVYMEIKPRIDDELVRLSQDRNR